MNYFADAYGAQRAESLRSTELPKQIATLYQMMKLKENEIDVLATSDMTSGFIDSTIIFRITKLLLNMEKGRQTLDSLDEETIVAAIWPMDGPGINIGV